MTRQLVPNWAGKQFVNLGLFLGVQVFRATHEEKAVLLQRLPHMAHFFPC